jgi:hypothetical protein
MSAGKAGIFHTSAHVWFNNIVADEKDDHLHRRLNPFGAFPLLFL